MRSAKTMQPRMAGAQFSIDAPIRLSDFIMMRGTP